MNITPLYNNIYIKKLDLFSRNIGQANICQNLSQKKVCLVFKWWNETIDNPVKNEDHLHCHTNVGVWKKLITTAGCCCSQKCWWFFCFQSFFESHHAPAAERTVQQCCENILLNTAWLKRDADDIHQYLLQRKAPPVWPPNSDPSLTCSLTPKWASSGYLHRKQKWFQNCNSILRITQESIKRSETRKQDCCSLLSVT